ncbi:hypothetical protein AB0H71_03625 [Nocardia sp. NPDC050697]|uniref:hypothetical protein n=1 Tax=Nocardia sp. NPDC050697 TaxID=3155158 RepID=UPI0033E3F22E
MPIRVTDSHMTSEVSPEFAFRVMSGGKRPWRLSWCRDRALTAEQARAGMELDELVSDPALVDDPMAFALMQERAHRLGMVLAQAVVLLAKAMAARAGHGVVQVAAREPAPGARAGDIGIPRRARGHGPTGGLEYFTDRYRPHTEPPVVFP